MSVMVTHEADRVIIDLGGRRRDVLLGMIEAEDMAAALERFAGAAEREAPTLIRGEMWEIKVISFDRTVAIRFYPPIGTTTTRVRMPVDTARKLAGRIRFAKQQAAYGMRFEFVRDQR